MPSLKMFHQRIDVFSFLALLLEIITRSKNSTAGDSDKALNFQTNVWNCYTKGVALQLINRLLDGHTSSKVMRCIHMSSLCKRAFKLQVKHIFSCCDANQRVNKATVPTKAGNPLWDLQHGVA
ncbi:hypothetical protein PVAP13_4KG316600 [Panicum virgatum]|uniref:Uncharacterized protein n=1 Tax=Panicum virgatum TaxID=38727 RepID=A0A8T0TSA5_PANVG|nr:hypothetical protein PVAP13_4KG316600 [Panicum virgatum]